MSFPFTITHLKIYCHPERQRRISHIGDVGCRPGEGLRSNRKDLLQRRIFSHILQFRIRHRHRKEKRQYIRCGLCGLHPRQTEKLRKDED